MTGVQTCALPILALMSGEVAPLLIEDEPGLRGGDGAALMSEEPAPLLTEDGPALRHQKVPDAVEEIDDFLESDIFVGE